MVVCEVIGGRSQRHGRVNVLIVRLQIVMSRRAVFGLTGPRLSFPRDLRGFFGAELRHCLHVCLLLRLSLPTNKLPLTRVSEPQSSSLAAIHFITSKSVKNLNVHFSPRSNEWFVLTS